MNWILNLKGEDQKKPKLQYTRSIYPFIYVYMETSKKKLLLIYWKKESLLHFAQGQDTFSSSPLTLYRPKDNDICFTMMELMSLS